MTRPGPWFTAAVVSRGVARAEYLHQPPAMLNAASPDRHRGTSCRPPRTPCSKARRRTSCIRRRTAPTPVSHGSADRSITQTGPVPPPRTGPGGSAAWAAVRVSDDRRPVERVVSQPGQAVVDGCSADDPPHLADPLSGHHRDLRFRLCAGRAAVSVSRLGDRLQRVGGWDGGASTNRRAVSPGRGFQIGSTPAGRGSQRTKIRRGACSK